MAGKTRAHGFTFVEVLATLAFIGIALPVVLRGVGLATAATGSVRHQRVAAMLAQDLLAELLLGNAWQYTGLEGDFAPEHPEFAWRAEIGEWLPEGGSPGAGLFQLTVTVTWLERHADRSVSFATLVAAPGET